MLVHTKYLNSGPYGFTEEDFLFFLHYKCMRANHPRGESHFNPRDMVGRIFVVDHSTLLHTKCLSSGIYGFRG